jgi:hypothetical protein
MTDFFVKYGGAERKSPWTTLQNLFRTLTSMGKLQHLMSWWEKY